MSVDRTRDLQIFSLTLSQLSYSHLSSGGLGAHTNRNLLWAIFFTESGRPPHESWVMCMVLCLFVPGCAYVRLTPTTMCIFERQIELASLIQYFAFSSHDSISNSKCISGKEKKTDPSIKCIGGERDCIFDSPLSSEVKMHAHLHRLLEEESVMHSTTPKYIYVFAFSVEVSLKIHKFRLWSNFALT